MNVPIGEKYMLTIKEAAAYFNIGIKKMRRLAEDNLECIILTVNNDFMDAGGYAHEQLQ